MSHTPGPQIVIVGSGPAGVSVALPLVQAGVRVLMLDGSDGRPQPPPPTAALADLRRTPGGYRALFENTSPSAWAAEDMSPKLATPRAKAALAGFAEAVGLRTEGFHAFGSLARGGLSGIWGAAAVRYDDSDLATFPCAAEDMQESYRRVSSRIGVSAPPEFAPAIGGLLRREPPPDDGVHLKPATNAVLLTPRDGREACSQCGLCLWGCARDSIYSSLHDLEALLRFPNFSLRGGHFVRSLRAEGNGHVLDIEGDGDPVVAPVVILAAGTISTSALALRRLGILGHDVRLLTNPVAALAFVVPRHFGADLPERSFGLGQIQYRLRLSDGSSAVGLLYGADTLPPALLADRIPLSRPLALRFARALAPALVLATCYLPGSYSRNTLRLEKRGDKVGVAITGTQAPEAGTAMRAAARQLAAHMRRRGAYLLPGSFTVSNPGCDAHYAGTLPMGKATQCGSSAQGELNGAPNLYVADGSALPVLAAHHCTLTIMANADRIGRALAQRYV